MAHIAATGTGHESIGQSTDARTISIITLGQALSTFFIFSYSRCASSAICCSPTCQ